MTAPSDDADAERSGTAHDESDTIEQAIAAQERLRGVVADAVIDTTITALRARLSAIASPQPAKQRKQVTVLFADVSGSTALAESLDAEEISDAFDSLWSRLDLAITRNNGLVDKHIGDAVMGIWGAGEAREDDPEQAIRAALEMQAEVAAFGIEGRPTLRLAIRIGINTGPVVLADVGSTAEFTAMGDTVNVASRLEGAAPVGGVLIGHDTYRHVKGIFEVGAREPLRVKGKSDPLLTYLVTAIRPRAFRVPTRGIEGVETAMVGRDRELTSLEAAAGAVSDDKRARLVTVVGEAGIGKSRLLNAFEDWLALRREDTWLFRGRADRQHEGVPYDLIRDLLFFRFEIGEDDPTGVAMAKLEAGFEAFVGPEATEEAHFLGHLIGLDLSASPVVGGIRDDARQLRERGAAATVRLFAAAAEDSPVIILLEDVHWADIASLDLIEHVLGACAERPILAVALARPLLFERRPSWGESVGSAERIDLESLDDEESRRLVAEVLQRLESVPDSIVSTILDNAEGNPFYVEEIVKMLIDGGAISTGGETWRVSPDRLATVKVPPTLTGVIQARLDRLTPTERGTLQRASVVGRTFWDEAIPPPADTGVRPSKEDSRRDLAALAGRSLVRRRAGSSFSGTAEFVFHHALLHEVTYESVLLRWRKQYHRSIADWLAERADGARLTAAIARHYLAAGAPEEAAVWFVEAGRDAKSRYANAEAEEHFTQALSLGTLDTAHRLSVYDDLGEVLLLQARYEEALAMAETMADEARAARDDPALASALVGSAYPLLRLGRFKEALAASRTAEQILREVERPDPSALAEALRTQGTMNLRLGETKRALTLAEESLDLTSAAGDERGTARSLGIVGMAHNMLGNYTAAREAFERALEIDRGRGDRRAETAWLINLGEGARFRGDYAAAESLHLEALAIERAFGDEDQQALSLSNLGGTYLAIGDHARAIDHLERSLHTFAAAGALEHVSETHRFLAEATLRSGDNDRALVHARAALAQADADDADQVGHAWRVLGLVAAGRGGSVAVDPASEPVRSSACFDRALEAFTRAGQDHDRAQCLWDRANVEFAGGDRRLAAAWWHEAHAIFERLGLTRLAAAMDAEASPPAVAPTDDPEVATHRPAVAPNRGSATPAG